MPLKAMQYEIAGTKKTKQVARTVDQTTTPVILWKLIVRHKLFLLTVGNVILVLNWVFPAWPEFIKSLI